MMNFLSKKWSQFTLQARLIVISTFLVSLIMSGLSFFALNIIKEETNITDKSFVQDLTLLLTTNVIPLIEEGLYDNLVNVSKSFYNSTSCIRYIIYLDDEGDVYYSIPFFKPDSYDLFSNRFLSKDFISLGQSYWIGNSMKIDTLPEVTNVFLDLYSNDQNIGFLILGVSPNLTIINSSRLTIRLSTLIFFSIWIIVVLGAAFNALSITQPIKELMLGVKHISAGQFYKRIDLPFEGDLGELIDSFNDMANKLQSYREQNLEELTAEKMKLEVLVSRIADGAILLDANLCIILINPIAIKALDLDLVCVQGKNVVECLPTDINKVLLPRLTKLMEMPPDSDFCLDTQELSIRFVAKQQKTIRIFLNLVVPPNKNLVKGVVMTIQDITKETELNDAKSQFISNVSHELRTPLFNILSFLETLYEYNESLTDSEKLEFLDIANKETRRLTRLVNDILNLSRLESDREYLLQSFDISLLIEQVVRSYQLTIKEKNIRLVTQIETNLFCVYGNYDLILQSILNLVGNAFKFTHINEQIVIRVSYVDDSLTSLKRTRVEVSDTGIGITAVDQRLIFDRFLRIENSTHTLEGTGLGLSIVKNCISKHKSSIYCRSEVNSGSTFWFDL
nr:dfr [Erythrotrichia welwitschii]